MTRDELDTAHADAIRRHWHNMLTAGRGQPTDRLLDDLAEIADAHASNTVAASSVGQGLHALLDVFSEPDERRMCHASVPASTVSRWRAAAGQLTAGQLQQIRNEVQP